MRLLPYGPRAVLVEFDSLDEVTAAATAWRQASLTGVVDVVPAERTVLVVHDGSLDPRTLEHLPVDGGVCHGAPRLVTIGVRYDGPDLAEVAAACDTTVDEVVRLHCSVDLTVAFCGFMPGFAYMVGLPHALHLPRRATPRTRVEPGSVAIAAGYCGVYPRQSPGGWHLLGTTDTVLWDDTAEPPALLSPGTTVRFVPT